VAFLFLRFGIIRVDTVFHLEETVPKYEIEMLWDCSSCGTTKIGGTQDHCSACGAAHDTKKDPWYIPQDTSISNRITDPNKIRMAKAGSNWTCEYCQGTQRNPDGSCRNCAGLRHEEVVQQVSGRSPDPVQTQWPPVRNYSGQMFIGVGLVGLVLILGLLWFLFHKRPVDIQVTTVEWTQTVLVERYKQVAQSGFDEDMPQDAADIVNEGSRVHHYDQVLDHYEMIHYTEQVYDGEDCVTVPQTCYTTPVNCTSNDNGTASCSGGDEVCSGGGQSCTARYRTENRTREEPVYRDEPRYEDHYAWTVWRWKPQRQSAHSGNIIETTWPDDQEICLNCNVGEGEKERESGRAGTYEVHFLEAEGGKTFDYEPNSEAEFHRFPIGSTHMALYSVAGGLDFSTVMQ
jgi:hypothetical protein